MSKKPSSDVRVDQSLNEAERSYVEKRTETCQTILQTLGINCVKNEVPNIAVLGSGGGMRAMVALLGALCQLKKEGILDAILYLSGVSGSTWAMASLYKEADWSKNLKNITDNITKRLVNGEVTYGMQFEKLRKYYQKDNFSLTHVWAVFISGKLKEIDEHVLTEQKNKHSADPYPIFNVIDKKCKCENQCKDVWFEITPDESGFSLGGAFVDTACLGSKYDKGKCTKNCLADDMLYLQGLCGSALADMAEIRNWIWEWLKSLVPWLSKSEKPEVKEQCKLIEALLDLNSVSMDKKKIYLRKIQHLLEDKRFEGSQIKNKILNLERKMSEEDVIEFTVFACDQFLSFGWITDAQIILTIIKLLSLWTWGTTYNIVYDMKVKDIAPTVMNNQIRAYEDAGLLLNSSYFSVLRDHRKVDLIISLDFSSGDPFETVKKAAKLCDELKIPFPQVHTDPVPKDFYVYKGNGPVVIHIPLFNSVNCNGNISWWENQYATKTFSYTPKMITDLMEKSALNISHNKVNLLNEIKDIIYQKQKK